MMTLAAEKVSKVFRRGTWAEVRALEEVSVAVAPGDFALLTGPSGSGKSTLLALLGALERPSGGRVLFQGRELGQLADTELARVRRRMGFVFQNFSLLPGLPAWENVTYPLIPRGLGRAKRYEIAALLLCRLGLRDKMTARPSELSGGEQQRLAVARALAGQPEVLLADEPTSNLDPEAASTIAALFKQIHAEGKTVVLSSHDPGLVALASHVYELKAGRLTAVSGHAALGPVLDR